MKGRDPTVIRRLTAVLTALLLVCGLAAAPVFAGAQKPIATLTQVSPEAVPFAAKAQLPAAKPMKVETAKAGGATFGAVRADKLEAGLAAKVDAGAIGANELIDVLVTTNTDPAVLSNKLAGMQIGKTFSHALNGFSAKVTRAQLAQLQAMGEVRSIGLNGQVTVSDDGASYWTGATEVRQALGITGDGDGWRSRYSKRDVVIAIVDTGIDTGHKDLAGKVIGWKDMVNGWTTPYDDHGHGTHVSGIAAGAGVANPAMAGVAPGAALVGVKVLDSSGSGTFDQVIAGVDWVVANKDTYHIRIMSMSLGAWGSSDGQDALSQAVNGAADAGIVAVVAAGNAGPWNYSVSTPAAAEKAITVCAMMDPARAGWTLAWFSSRGPTADNRVKPDICAPGYNISAPMAGTTNKYVAMSGTSMATPFISGVAALLLEVDPYLTVDEVKQLLYSTADHYGVEGQNYDFGYGRVNAYRAVTEAMGMAGDAPANSPIHGTAESSLTSGAGEWWVIPVTDTKIPIGLTMLMNDAMDRYYDLDMYLYDPDGYLVDYSFGVDRQETINYRPVKKGTYFIRVVSYTGSGSYSLDASWR